MVARIFQGMATSYSLLHDEGCGYLTVLSEVQPGSDMLGTPNIETDRRTYRCD